MLKRTHVSSATATPSTKTPDPKRLEVMTATPTNPSKKLSFQDSTIFAKIMQALMSVRPLTLKAQPCHVITPISRNPNNYVGAITKYLCCIAQPHFSKGSSPAAAAGRALSLESMSEVATPATVQQEML